MRSLKAQLMGMVSGKSQKPPDSTILPDSATNTDESPPSQSRALGLPEESGACATVICGVQRGKGVMAVKRVRIGGRWRARIDKR